MLQLLCRILVGTETSGSKIAQSLEDSPEAWVFDEFYAVHGSGVSVWIANAAYGLHVYLDGRSGNDKWSPSWAERHLIWKAAKNGVQQRKRKLRKKAADNLVNKLAQL